MKRNFNVCRSLAFIPCRHSSLPTGCDFDRRVLNCIFTVGLHLTLPRRKHHPDLRLCHPNCAAASAQNSISLDKTDATGTQSHIGAPAEQASAKVQLTCLLAPNASAHEHEMTPQQLQALSQAKVLLVSGVDLEHFLDQAVSASGSRERWE